MKHRVPAILPALATFAVFTVISRNAFGALACMHTPQGQQCSAHITQSIIPDQQKSMVTCWAASLHNYLKFFGVNVSEQQIVTTTTGNPMLANSQIIAASQNHIYRDESTGQLVTLKQSAVTDNIVGYPRQISNQDIINLLRANQPIFYGDQNHAMVLEGVTFLVQAGGQPVIVDASVYDPAIPALRHAQPHELAGMYASVIAVRPVTVPTAPINTSTVTTQGPSVTPPLGMTFKCQFSAGLRAGTVADFSGIPGVQPIPIGLPCQDGAGSSGISVP